VRRMLRDPKARALVDNFAGQWLQFRNVDTLSPDPKVFPKFDDVLRASMRRETELFFETIVRQDRSVLEFLTADWTWVNERLASHYGLTNALTSATLAARHGRRRQTQTGESPPTIRGGGGQDLADLAPVDEFQRICLLGTPRRGVLTHASVLLLTSNPTRTSPVKRGKWVLENLLNAPPPPPPPNVPELKEDKELTGTFRQRLEQHRADALCASCHARMDPIGFGLENFDGIGAWRTHDGAASVDASGTLVSGESFDGPRELSDLLSKKKDAFIRCLADKTLTYALGRGLEYYDKCALDQITRGLARSDYKFSALILEVVKSAPFQMRRGDAAAAATATGPH
jgi:hypothetical protein